MPSNLSNPLFRVGAMDNDAINAINDTFDYTLISDATVVSLTNPTSATDLKTGVVKAGTISQLGEGLDIFAAGTYNVAAASTVVFTIKFGGVTIATFTTASQTNTAVTLNWNLSLKAIAAVLGTSGTLEVHGSLNFDSGATLAAAASVFNDSITAASSAIDLTQDQTLEIMANFGSGNASSVIAQRMLIAKLIN